MSASDNLNPRQFFHGTHHKFEPGAVLDPAQKPGIAHALSSPDHFYFTTSRDKAEAYARDSWMTHNPYGDPHTYEVEPLGHYEPDESDTRFPDQFQTRNHVRIKSEVFDEPWDGKS